MQAEFRELPARRRFGVELEVSKTVSKYEIGVSLQQYESSLGEGRDVVVTPGLRGWEESRNNDYWHVKYDSTCGPRGKGKDSGWEIASYVGQGYRDVTHISSAADWLRDFGLKTNRNCGLHVHVEARDLNFENMGILLARWIKAEHFLVAICEPHRKNNQYCKRLRVRWNDRQWCGYNSCKMVDFWTTMAPGCFNTHNNEEKKYTLNTVGYALGNIVPLHNRQTIELRLPECTLDSLHVFHWLNLILNLVDVCKGETEGPINMEPAETVSEALSLLGLHQEGGTFIFLDNRLLGTKLWLLQKLASSPQVPDVCADEASELLEFISEI